MGIGTNQSSLPLAERVEGVAPSIVSLESQSGITGALELSEPDVAKLNRVLVPL